MGAPHRRTIYIASLEAHVDRLHGQLLAMGLYPIPFDKLEPYKGLNSKTAKVKSTLEFHAHRSPYRSRAWFPDFSTIRPTSEPSYSSSSEP